MPYKRVLIVVLIVLGGILAVKYFSPQSTPTDPVVGSKTSNVYHRWNCQYAKSIDGDNLIQFDSPEKARGYRPCKICMRPPAAQKPKQKQFDWDSFWDGKPY